MSKMKQRQDAHIMRPGNVAELSFDSAAVCDYLALLYKNTLREQEMRPASRESVGWADFQENKDHGKEIEREMDRYVRGLFSTV